MPGHSCGENQLKTAVVLATPAVVAVVAGQAIAGTAGATLGLGLGVAVTAVAYFRSDRIALRAMRARPVSEAEAPGLCQVVRETSQRMRLPMPAVYVSPTPAPNAFATGRDPRRAAVCVTDGLLRLLDARELRAVVAHELSHVANRDILLGSVAAGLASMIVYVAQFAWLIPLDRDATDEGTDEGHPLAAVLLLVLGPLAAVVVRLTISRSREYAADAEAARVTGDPAALASALRKLRDGTRRLPLLPQPELQTTAALMIANPFRARGLARLFSTHPPTARRIARLEYLAGDDPR